MADESRAKELRELVNESLNNLSSLENSYGKMIQVIAQLRTENESVKKELKDSNDKLSKAQAGDSANSIRARMAEKEALDFKK